MAKGGDIYTEHAQRVYRYLFSLCGEADTAAAYTRRS